VAAVALTYIIERRVLDDTAMTILMQILLVMAAPFSR